MTPENFCYWLQGKLEGYVSEKKELHKSRKMGKFLVGA